MTKKQVLKDYISFKNISVKHEGKLKDISNYIKYFLESSKKNVSDFKEKELINYLSQVSNKYSIPSQNTIKPILKHFIKWKFEDYSTRFRNLNSLCKMQKAESTYKADEMLTEKEIVKLANGETSLMWKNWFLLLFFGAFRPSELAKLQFKNIDLQKDGTAIIKVFLTKNKKDVYKSIPEPATICLKKWIEKLEPEKEDYIFPSPLREGDHISAKTGYFRIVKLSKRVLGKQVNPYQIRHSFGSIKYNDDSIRDKGVVAEQMGHNKSMEFVYKHLNNDQKITNAKKIWAKKDDLPEEERKRLQKQIDELTKNQDKQNKLLFILCQKEQGKKIDISKTLKELNL